jgi:NAD-dependent SIR2 family protein deacetylase
VHAKNSPLQPLFNIVCLFWSKAKAMQDPQKIKETYRAFMEENKRKGKNAEHLFKDYLNAQKIPFFYIDQSADNYSEDMAGKKSTALITLSIQKKACITLT